MYLEIKDVKKSYGEDGSFVQVLNGITTEVEHGEMCVIHGTSGSGKSTLANELEKHLAALGKHTMLLDGDNVRMGLTRTGKSCQPDCLRCLSFLLCAEVSCNIHLMPCEIICTS